MMGERVAARERVRASRDGGDSQMRGFHSTEAGRAGRTPAALRSWMLAPVLVGAALASLPPSGCGGSSPGGSTPSEALPKGYFDVEVRDADSNELIPAKISVFDANEDSAAIIPGNSEGDLLRIKLNEIYLGRGTGRIHLYDGQWDLYFSHGIEYTVFKKHLDITYPVGTQKITLKRAVDTTGYVSADFHIHARPSFESSLQPGGLPTLEDRVITYLAEGVEIMGSSDHQCIVDYSSTIAQLGVGDRIGSLVGVEATPPITSYPSGDGNCSDYRFVPPPLFTEPGHWNAFPLDPGQSYDTTSDKGVNAATLYDRLRKLGAQGGDTPLIQLNHPFYELGFINIGWLQRRDYRFGAPIPFSNPLAPNAFLTEKSTEAGSKTRSIDFDAMELWSGGSYVYGIPARNAWFEFLNQGLLKVGTSNSDSHNTKITAGFPRNFVRLGTDDPSRATPRQVAAAVRSGKVVGTTGPFIRVLAGSAEPGDLVAAPSGSITLRVNVQAAPWVPVEEIRIYANGTLARQIAVGKSEKSVRFDKNVTLDLARDASIVIEAGSAIPADPTQEPPEPEIYRHVTTGTNGFRPIGFTNPLFVDVDGNGSFDPPGLS